MRRKKLQKAIQRAETTIKLDNGNTPQSAQAQQNLEYLKELEEEMLSVINADDV